MVPKILILSCNTGEGHNSCAKALKHSIESDGMRCDVHDALGLSSVRFSTMISDIYGFSLRNSLFGKIYGLAEWYSSKKHRFRSPLYQLFRLFSDKLSKVITENGYDAVLCTHLFPAEMLTLLRNSNRLSIASFYISTDYTCYPLLNETDLDGYMIAHPDLIPEFIRKGIPQSRIYPTGIPCRGEFHADRMPRTDARRIICSKFSWVDCPSSGKWFLVMGGSMGFGNMSELVGCLIGKCSDNDRIICVCGTNAGLKLHLEKDFPDSDIVKSIGYTDMIPTLMYACDVLFTKPGGLTSTEALHWNIPMIHTHPIKGPEELNVSFFLEHNMSYRPADPREQAETAFRLCEDAAFREPLLEAQRQNRYDACHRIIEIIKENFR